MTDSTQIFPKWSYTSKKKKKLKRSTIGNTANPKDIWKRNFSKTGVGCKEGTDVRDEKHSQVLYLNFFKQTH